MNTPPREPQTDWQRWCDRVSANLKLRPLTDVERRVIAMGEQIAAERAAEVGPR